MSGSGRGPPAGRAGVLQTLHVPVNYFRYIDPNAFIECLGLDAALQQDAQEFSKLFMSLLTISGTSILTRSSSVWVWTRPSSRTRRSSPNSSCPCLITISGTSILTRSSSAWGLDAALQQDAQEFSKLFMSLLTISGTSILTRSSSVWVWTRPSSRTRRSSPNSSCPC